jgi:hypothetical protein
MPDNLVALHATKGETGILNVWHTAAVNSLDCEMKGRKFA